MKGVNTSKILSTKFPPSLSTRSAAAACRRTARHNPPAPAARSHPTPPQHPRHLITYAAASQPDRAPRKPGRAPRQSTSVLASRARRLHGGFATWQSTSRRMFHSCLRYSPLSSASPSAATSTTPRPCVSDSTTPAKCLHRRACSAGSRHPGVRHVDTPVAAARRWRAPRCASAAEQRASNCACSAKGRGARREGGARRMLTLLVMSPVDPSFGSP